MSPTSLNSKCSKRERAEALKVKAEETSANLGYDNCHLYQDTLTCKKFQVSNKVK